MLTFFIFTANKKSIIDAESATQMLPPYVKNMRPKIFVTTPPNPNHLSIREDNEVR
jgi:hypothetical protein